MRAWVNLRHQSSERAAAFRDGLEKLGYEVQQGIPTGPDDLFVTWNRIGDGDRAATMCEREGRPVLVCENATWGNHLAGRQWLTLARSRHNTAGMFPMGGAERWDELGIELAPWRAGGETVVIGQRGIGAPPTAMPRDWLNKQQGRLRPHPGRGTPKPLEDDLAKAGKVITWGSGAAVKALMWGIPVESHMPNWIAEQDNTDAGRLEMFRRLAWAQWTLAEIESGEAFEWLLMSSVSQTTG